MSGSTIKFKLSGFEQIAKKMDGLASQIPFALARALNDSAEQARTVIVEELWPSKIKARNANFAKAAFTTAGNKATKKNLRVAVVESDRIKGRGNLILHADGGTKRAKNKNIAIPSRDLQAKRGASGVPKSQRPRMLKNSFVEGDIIYVRWGKYKKATKAQKKMGTKRGTDNRHKRLLYTLKRTAPIRKDVPMRESFRDTMKKNIDKNFRKRFEQAMKSLK